MDRDIVDTVRSVSSGTVGRAVNHARGQALVLDSSHHPKDDALTNSEAFLGAISSCGVTLIEGHAQSEGIPLERTAVTIEGARPAADPTRFERISMRFEFAGVSREQAEHLVGIWRER